MRLIHITADKTTEYLYDKENGINYTSHAPSFLVDSRKFFLKKETIYINSVIVKEIIYSERVYSIYTYTNITDCVKETFPYKSAFPMLRSFFKNAKQHRVDGPALLLMNSLTGEILCYEYYINGKKLCQQDYFLEKIRLDI